MKKINLIPEEFSVGDSTNKIVKRLQSISLVGGVVAIFSALIFLGVFVFYFQELRNANATNEDLKFQMQNLSQSEQKYIFAKDRLQKIDKIMNKDSALDEFGVFKYVYDYINGLSGVSVTELEIKTEYFEMSLLSTNFSSTASFFDFIDDNKDRFGKVKVSSFSYIPATGYVFSLTIETNGKK